jgi:hypothetical protein
MSPNTNVGYSGTPLPKKLGLKEGMRMLAVNWEGNYSALVGKLPAGAKLLKAVPAGGEELDFIHLFAKTKAEAERGLKSVRRALSKQGTLWISWPKGASGLQTDLSEGVVMELGLRAGLVDVKVCAVTETWSGLKFVYRLKDR